MLQRPTIHRCASIAIAVKHTNTGALQLQATGGSQHCYMGRLLVLQMGEGTLLQRGRRHCETGRQCYKVGITRRRMLEGTVMYTRTLGRAWCCKWRSRCCGRGTWRWDAASWAHASHCCYKRVGGCCKLQDRGHRHWCCKGCRCDARCYKGPCHVGSHALQRRRGRCCKRRGCCEEYCRVNGEATWVLQTKAFSSGMHF